MEHTIFHATPLEWVFFIVSVLVVLMAVWSEREAALDLAALTAQKVDGSLRATAFNGVRESWFAIFIGLDMLIASSLALLFEPPPPNYNELPQTLSFLVAWIVLGVLTTVSSLLSKSSRRKLMDESPREHQETVFVTESPKDEDSHPGPAVITKGRRAGDSPPVPEKEDEC